MLHSTKSAGKHRKQSPNKGRVAMVAVATGAVSTAGLSGAAAAALQGDGTQQADSYTLAADTDQLTALTDEAAPQILAIAEYKPVENLADQLVKAVAHSELSLIHI